MFALSIVENRLAQHRVSWNIVFISRNCKRHELQHTSEFPYECPFEGCERRFKSRSALNYHTKTHSGQKEYVCTFGDCRMK